MVDELTYDLTSIKTALGASAAFRTWVSESTQANARAHVYLFGGPKEDLPIVVLSHGGEWRRDVSHLGTDFQTQPTVIAEFISSCSKADSDETVFLSLLGAVSAIMAELETQTVYRIDAWYPDSEATPARAKASASEDFCGARIVIEGNMR